tara:strand:- start:99 stop:2204 length:2106 start_codon:yes stop_codon:yes gene_type:complete
MRKINSISVCFTLIFFFAFFSNQCFSRESNCYSAVSLGNPEIRCVSVDNFGDVTISWLEIDDPLGIFIEYRVYSSISGGPFTLIGSETNRLTTTFIDIGANANLASVEYYISCVSNSGGAILEENSLDTLASIFLDLTNPSNGTAILQWNDVTNPSLSTMSNYYYIYMEFPSGTWTLIDSVPTAINSYIDTITICDDFLNFRIGIQDQLGCISYSNIEGDQFQDMLPPDIPVINYVSVDTSNGFVEIDWDSTYFEDTYAYIIFQNINGVWEVIDTVDGYNITYYLNSNSSNSSFQIDNYGVAAYDSCLNGNPNTSPVSASHNTILLTNELNICELSIDLNWNSYDGWSNGVAYYNLYSSKDNAPWIQLAQLSPGSTSYTHFSIDGLSTYNYLIEAVENGAEKSLSNISERYVYQPNEPAFSYLSSVSVLDENLIEVEFYADNSVNVNGFELFRSEDGVNFQYTDWTNSNPVLFQDTDVSTQLQSYSYYVNVIDSCNRIAASSNVAKSIFLSGEPKYGLTNSIYWSSYDNWDGSVDRYEIYRKINDVYEPNPVAVLAPINLSFEDDISSFLGTNADGQFCYKIKAIEQVNSFGFSAESFSNEFCINQEPVVYAPNSFTPNGDLINDNWIPVVNLLDFNNYSVSVYNRLNHLVFETSDVAEGWDGSFLNSSKQVPLGVYLYFIEFRNGRGDYLRKQGHITLIR